MSGYNGRPGLNFSQFITNLNTVQQPFDTGFLATDDLDLSPELALFTNADFTEFDNLGPLPDHGIDFDLGDSSKLPEENIDNLLAKASPSTNTRSSNPPYFTSYPPVIQPAPSPSSHSQNAAFSPPSASSPTSPDSLSRPTSLKRKADVFSNASPQHSPADQQSRLAAEEDKRRRNTAASARFRVKKKQREQTLECTVKEVNDKNAALEAKIDQLEMENQWLKNLITEKNAKQTKEEIAEAFRKYRRESEERETNRGNGHKEVVDSR